MNDESLHPNTPSDVGRMTAAHIYNHEFKRSIVGGYDASEVEEFLDRVGDAFEAMAVRLQILEDRNQDNRERLEAYRRSEETLHNTLVASQKFNENTLTTAKREAESLVQEARMIRDRAQFEADRLPEALAKDVQQLRDQRTRLRAELAAMLDTYQNFLDNMVSAEERVAEQVSAALPKGENTAPEPPAASVESKTPQDKEAALGPFFPGQETEE